MKVSVITVCKNSARTIEHTIEGVVNQTYHDIEYIIVDGDSQDETEAIACRYGDRITQFISEPDQGIYQAMNKGISLATGSFIYFSNSDDYLYDSNVIQDLVSFVLEHPDCDFVYGDHEARFIFGDASIHKPVSPENMLEEMMCLGDHRIHQPASLFKTDLFSKLGLFNEAYRIASDYEWLLRLLQHPTLKLYYYPRVIVSYAHGGASGNIRALFEEVFDIQRKDSLCQRCNWLAQRLARLQQIFIDKYDLLERTNKLSIVRLQRIEALENQFTLSKTQLAPLKEKIAALEAEIEAMKSSKFWKLRMLWFRVKQVLGLPLN